MNPFGNDPDEEKRDEDHTVPQKVHYQTHWKHNQDPVFWIKLSMTQDQGLQFWHAKSFAIITNVTVPGNCTHRVISQNGLRVQFGRPARKIALKSKEHTQQQQQQQQSVLNEDVKSIQETEAKAKQECETKRRPPRKWE